MGSGPEPELWSVKSMDVLAGRAAKWRSWHRVPIHTLITALSGSACAVCWAQISLIRKRHSPEANGLRSTINPPVLTRPQPPIVSDTQSDTPQAQTLLHNVFRLPSFNLDVRIIFFFNPESFFWRLSNSNVCVASPRIIAACSSYCIRPKLKLWQRANCTSSNVLKLAAVSPCYSLCYILSQCSSIASPGGVRMPASFTIW